jgi:LemA protein
MRISRAIRAAYLLLMLTTAALPLAGCGVNNIPNYQEQAKAAWAQVLNQYQRRADLVPNLVNTVKGAADFERKTLEAVVEARAKVGQTQLPPDILTNQQAMQQFAQNQAALTSALSRLLVVVEQYPDLKANANFQTLQAQLEGTENGIAVARRDFAGYTIEDWGLALGRGWSIGQKGRNNGVLLLVAPKDRELRIEVGYGLEGDLPDATANRIIQSIIIPEFRAANMPLGIEAGVQAIIKTLGGEIQGNAIAPPASGDASGGALPAAAIFFIFFAFMAIMNMRRRRSGPWGGGYYPYGYGGGGFGRGGGFSGRSSSNGGFSGGGGSFGGGGASGRW